MKIRLVITSLILCVSYTGPAHAASPAPLPDSSIYRVFPSIRFIEGADLDLFRETYARSIGQQRAEYVNQATSLMMVGAGGTEAAKMLIAFDQHILNLRKQGRAQLGTTLEAVFKARLDEFYRYFQPQIQKLQFANMGSAQSNYDMAIYGVYSVNSNRKPGLQITVTVLNLRTGLEQNFVASGEGVTATQDLAGQVFHEYQSTKFPSSLKLMGKSIELVTKGMINRPSTAKMKDLNQEASWVCDSYNAHLPSEDDLRALGGLGDYRGGITIGKSGEENAHWALAGGRVYVSSGGWTAPDTNVNPAAFLNYICVRGGSR
ncbi:hypothetical protein [Bdellovibrio svalbardensis]|uniref:Uncharacterized protein n=1 Tax=Bdellovibrio svalbardensis TaxID=2972972 RepID=A0ABT6DJ18_9BACT|nr:hypothetical protein [Bdellovibrio svalbardensis]MDG0816837.1 hypothetical protein [Bdellovibrio svalbardensis]